MSVLVSASELAVLLADDSASVLDVRWALGDPHGRRHYLEGHLRSAVFVDLDTELAAPPSVHAGRHPLPALADLQASAQRWGLRAGRSVVVYDNSSGLAAARAWWLLRWGGLADVRILDGGLGAWTGPLEPGPVVPEPGDVVLTGGGLPVLDAAAAAALARSGVLLDARATERYRGDVEPIDPVAGHIPGAVSAPTTGNLDADGRFLSPGALAERFRALGAEAGTSVGAYCGSGVTAAHAVAALAIAGIPAALYAGSWSEWVGDGDRPVAIGDAPG